MSNRCQYPAALSALVSGSAWILFLLLLGWTPCRAQTTPLICTASAGLPYPIHQSEIAAAASDVIITCSGGTPTLVGAPVPKVDLQLYFNTDVTMRTAGPLAEALLLVDDPAPASQLPCLVDPLVCDWTGGTKNANVYQGRVLDRNALAFQGIPLDPPGDGKTRKFRITNIRVDASVLGPLKPGSYAVRAAISMSGAGTLATTLDVGVPGVVFTTAVSDTTGSAALDKTTGLPVSNCTSSSMRPLATLRFQSSANGAFRTRTIAPYVNTETAPAPAAQNVPGTAYGTQSLFYAPALPAVNKLNVAGLADFGTRLQATFSGLPEGVTLYVSTVPVTFSGGVPSPNGAGQFQARLVASEQGAFAPVPVAATISGIPSAALSVNQGSAVAVWEVLSTNGLAGETPQFPMWISYPGNGSSRGMATVRLHLGPVSGVHSSHDTAPIPRFADEGTEVPLFTLQEGCPTGPYRVGSLIGMGTLFEVDGIKYNAPAYFNWQPGSTHTLNAILQQPSPDGTSRTGVTWSDGGAPAHTIVAPATPTQYSALFNTQYRLDLAAIPSIGGAIQATPASPDGYYSAGANTNVQLQAVPNPGYTFLGFEGDLTGTQNPRTLNISKAYNVTAKFTKTGRAPVMVGVTPTFTSGPSTTLKATFQAAQSYKSILFAQALVAVSPDGGGQPFCFVHYDAVGAAFWLYSDIYGFFMGPVKPGVASTHLGGSDCVLNTANSSVLAGGQSLELTLQLSSKVAGDRNVYLRAMETDSSDTGWIRRGAWSQWAQLPANMNVTPDFGNRSIEGFSLSFSERAGFLGFNKGWTQFLIASDSTGGGQPFCFVHFDRAGQQLWMYSSDVGFFLGPVAPGVSSTTLDSSACMLDTRYSTSQTQSGASFLWLPITMKPPMSGPKRLYLRTLDALGIDSGWNQVGSYQVP
ncbi:InlB B-repeat-containing protein [Paludibaculum fermentans]|uniref:InlB B-repeat-containing protein n=1 Tax=Paludibaculum fermentans TaxID=1473598 RepID=UPI003EC154B8